MNRVSSSVILLAAPLMLLGTSACSSINQAQERLAQWKEKREEQKMERELAAAEKEMAAEAATSGQVASASLEDSIFLNYANPGVSLASEGDGRLDSGGGYAAGPALPGSELPVVIDLASAEGGMTDGSGPIFLGDAQSPAGSNAGVPPVDADLVRAWAASISPIMGASLTEPLITAAMTARVTPTESAVAAHAAATDSAPLASAFAGQPAQTSLQPSSSELEHH